MDDALGGIGGWSSSTGWNDAEFPKDITPEIIGSSRSTKVRIGIAGDHKTRMGNGQRTPVSSYLKAAMDLDYLFNPLRPEGAGQVRSPGQMTLPTTYAATKPG
ncbi:uncharacterized protein Z520_11484 [Fonsecaea multimorphosa CBS 102226]|uniref:Uncharacterized protein n=1 Tax=Fonsecaea multimorphosa CBS 102226 TaxID=1442371 RepID=A0A0D2I6H9_9EURO|nr:uncharacterized protein Z520_11484 [Fonsecaea multimorphosa CBS 102226]KIX92821.1 hypothetical protein Z520_11484 [Fonsecaea multimorphosa CBS 102226]